MTRSLHILLLVLLATLPARAVESRPAVSIALGDGLHAEVDAEGVVTIQQVQDGQARDLLRSHWPSASPIRFDDQQEGFLGTAREGSPGGRRGFTAAADDDGDGQVDEDRLDGVDNDGDGLIDEDFAAIGDVMVSWHRSWPAWSRHLEAYHWSYPSLQSLLAVTLQHDGSGLVDAFQLETASWSSWQAVDDACPETGDQTGGPTFFCKVPPAGPHQACWLAVVVLDDKVRSRPAERLRAEAGQLTMPLLDQKLTLVVSVGVSRLQVADDMLAAASLREGMTDPLTGTRLAWLPRPDWFAAREPAMVTVRDLGHAWDLRLEVGAGEMADLDPDRWTTGQGEPLTVTGLRWSPRDGEAVAMDWPRRSTASILCRPHQLLRAEGPGILSTSLARPVVALGDLLQAHRVDGRPVLFDVQRDTSSSTAEQVVADPTRIPHLSADLLTSYPNPFRVSTSINFQVPATVGAAFDLEAPDSPDLDPTRPMPYASTPPQVTVSIFNLEGRRVASLSSERRGFGGHAVSWDGRSEHGRAVPSGAYFCKLEIENWSVTKRLIFIR